MKDLTVKTLVPLVRCFLLPAMILSLTACGSSSNQTRYLHKNADLGALTKVAVLPFDNLAAERSAGDKVQKIFYLELLSLDVFEITEPGLVTKTLRGQTGLDAFGPADYQRIGKDLGADAVFIGTVVDFADTHAGSVPAPDVTIQLRLIETKTGTTLWSTSQSRSGTSTSSRLFGVGGESLTSAARRVVRNELSTLLK